jgi:hypothetical protein
MVVGALKEVVLVVIQLIAPPMILPVPASCIIPVRLCHGQNGR